MPATYEKHRAQLKAILLSWGMPEENAETTSEILSWADLHGVDSHGMSMIPGYDGLRRSGRAKMDAVPKIVKETPVSALVDGGGGLGHVPAHFAMNVAIGLMVVGRRGDRRLYPACLSRSVSRANCVVLPQPSEPSNEINTPLVIF